MRVLKGNKRQRAPLACLVEQASASPWSQPRRSKQNHGTWIKCVSGFASGEWIPLHIRMRFPKAFCTRFRIHFQTRVSDSAWDDLEQIRTPIRTRVQIPFCKSAFVSGALSGLVARVISFGLRGWLGVLRSWTRSKSRPARASDFVSRIGKRSRLELTRSASGSESG